MPLKKSGGPVVGLDIGTNFIKACEVECRGGKASLRGLAVLPTPPEAVANNEIVDPVSLGKIIRQVLKQNGIKASQVISSVTGQSSLVVRIIEVPKMTAAELKETMKWEIERHVPFAAEQVVMDYQPLVPPDEVPDGQNMEVLLAVAQEALVNTHVKTIQSAGLKPKAIDIEPLALSRSLIDIANGAGPTGTVAIIDIGANSTDISIYKEGRIAFTRSIQLAGRNLTKAIAEVLQRPLADCEQLKKDLAAIPLYNPAPAEPDPGVFGNEGLDFGASNPIGGDVLGGVLGGTFGMGATPPDAGTATSTHSDPEFDVAGSGFSPDLFTTPAPDAPAGEPSPFAASGEPPASPFNPQGIPTGPVPQGNPFDPDAALLGGGTPAPEPGAPAAGANPFESPASPFAPSASPFEAPAPAASPFGGASPFGEAGNPFGAPGDDPFGPPSLDGLGMPAGVAALGSGGTGQMSEEEFLKTQITDAIMPVLHEMVTELRRSLDFYRNRANGLGAQQVVICGGTAKLPGLSEFLTTNLEVPVTVGDPLKHLARGPKADAQYLEEVGPYFSVSVGLAVRELLVDAAPARKKKK